MLQRQVMLRAARAPRARRRRRGVLLLVVMALLALFTLIGLTLVLSASQARLSSVTSARAQSSGTPYSQQLSRAFHDVVRGSTNKFSSIQAHSLVEDLYGMPLFKGKIATAPTTVGAGSFGAGQLITFAYTNGLAGGSLTIPNVYPKASYQLSGLVLTMTSGSAAGQSARIVRDTIPNDAASGGIGGGLVTFYYLTVTPFGDSVLNIGDDFVINGRPFSGTGFGFQAASFNATAGNPIFQSATMASAPATFKLDAMDPEPALFAGAPLNYFTASQFLWPYALLPNHAKFTPQNPVGYSPTPAAMNSLLTTGFGWYTDPGGPGVGTYVPGTNTTTVAARAPAAPGGANEPYDAVDYQNMFLAMHYFDVNVDPTGLPPGLIHPVTLTPIPSFHRPELVAHWAQRISGGMAGKYPAATAALPLPLQQELRRKVILRPEPQDQGFNPTLQDMNGNGVFDYREPFTDLNANASYDIGEPFLDLNADGTYTPGDLDFTGKRFNPITGPYCIYHNPATGFETWVRDPLGDWDVDNDGDGLTDSIWVDLGYEPEQGPDGKLYKPLFAILCVDMDGKLNLNANGSIAQLDAVRYGGSMFGPFAQLGNTNGGTMTTLNAALSRNFQIGEAYGPAETNLLPLLQRSTFPSVANALPEYQRLLQGAYVTPPTGPPYSIDGRYGEVDNFNIATPDGHNNYAIDYLISGPMPGRTEQFDPYYLTQAVPVVQVNDPINQMMQSPLRPFLINYVPQQNSPYTPPGYFFDFITAQFNLTGAVHTPTGYSSPHNIHGRGAILLDFRGQPYYSSTSTLPWMAALVNPVGVGVNSAVNDTTDDPYELNLSSLAQRYGLRIGANYVSTIDAPFTPDEVERLLRRHDADSESLPSRIEQLAPSLSNAANPASGARHALTSDSWDLSNPGVTATDAQQQIDLNTSANVATPTYLQQGAFNAPLSTSLGSMSLADLARARIINRNPSWITNLISSGLTPQQAQAQALQYADLALFGSQMMQYPMGAVTNAVQPLLAPEFLEGLRIDINRPLGDGVDNNGNGIVDEPAEVLASALGDSAYYPTIDPTTGLATYSNYVNLDLNNDGYLPTIPPTPGDVSFYGDTRARQLLARHLYVLMMLLIDDQTLVGQIFATPSATPLYAALQSSPALSSTIYPTNPNTSTLAPSQQIAYFIAQWAINVVDFRDPDSICTPFEFDLNPFSDDDGIPANGTWDVDDLIQPANGMVDPWTNQTMTKVSADDVFPYRGLVFGCERPELVISEVAAFHDRGTDDTNQDNNTATFTTDTTNRDLTYDQVRRPRGSLIVELFNPNSPLNAPQADLLQTGGSVNSGSYTGALSGVGGVNLTQVVQAGATFSPVWRLAIGYSMTHNEKGFYTGSPWSSATSTTPPAAVDPRVPFLPNTPTTSYVHRVVYLAPVLPASNAVGEIAKGRSFYVDPTLVGSPVILPPNSYALVGPGVVDINNNQSGVVAALNFGVRNKTGDSTSGPKGKQNVYNMYAQMTNANGAVPAGLYNNYAAGSGPNGGGIGNPIPPYTAAGTPLTSQNIKPIVTLPIATLYLDSGATPTSISGNPVSTTLRMSVSEPEVGYPLMTTLAGGNPATWDDNFYYVTGGGKYPDIPFDNQNNSNGVTPNTYVAAPDGTILSYTTVYLQRLANPTAFWDPTANPYITVDSMPVDLTSYTGEASPPSGGTSNGIEPGAGGAGGGTIAFDARSRGQFYSNGELDVPNIWSPASTNPTQFATPSKPTTNGANYNPMQNSTLGFLNQTYWVNSAGGQTGNQLVSAAWQKGFYSYAMILNNTDQNGSQRLQSATASTGIAVSQYWGDPLMPFPWLTWNNRPYVSQYEMMLVPASSPSSLLSDFGENGYLYNPNGGANGGGVWTADNGNVDPYNPPNNSVIPTGTAVGVPLGAFHHLLNFYDSTFTYLYPATGTAVTTRTAAPQPANFFRLFEYVTVPSRFTGTQKMLNPAEFVGMTAGQHTFHPPFNWLSEYREPGRVNLNTVFDPVVFQGIMDDYPAWIPLVPGIAPTYSWQALWQGLIDTRRGNIGVSYNAAAGMPFAVLPPATLAPTSPMLPNLSLFAMPGQIQFPIYPTAFANPLRPEGAATLAPPFISPTTMTSYPYASLAQQPGQSINATLLRAQAPYSYSDPSFFGAAAGSGTPVAPLLNSTTYDSNNQASTYQVTTGTLPSRQAARNAYFDYQTQSRLGNLATNRSNVFAIWITVGYFEAVPVLPSAANPDGYQIGAEKGSEMGGFQRHRAFYMFDRSVPMGFTRGEDLNVDNGILVERVIE